VLVPNNCRLPVSLVVVVAALLLLLLLLLLLPCVRACVRSCRRLYRSVTTQGQSDNEATAARDADLFSAMANYDCDDRYTPATTAFASAA
jgi:hypothetical protein